MEVPTPVQVRVPQPVYVKERKYVHTYSGDANLVRNYYGGQNAGLVNTYSGGHNSGLVNTYSDGYNAGLVNTYSGGHNAGLVGTYSGGHDNRYTGANYGLHNGFSADVPTGYNGLERSYHYSSYRPNYARSFSTYNW